MPQKFLPLRTVAADDVAGGVNAPEEVRADRRGRRSGGDVGQVHVDADFAAGGGLGACGGRRTRNCCVTPKHRISLSEEACTCAG